MGSAENSATRTPAQSAGHAPDASMDLLNQIIRQPVDPDYASSLPEETSPPGRWASPC